MALNQQEKDNIDLFDLEKETGPLCACTEDDCEICANNYKVTEEMVKKWKRKSKEYEEGLNVS